MRYPTAQVRTALSAAKEAGKNTAGMSPDLRETELALEKWGYLPLPGDTTIEDKVAEWYVAQGLATPADDRPRRRKAAKSEPEVQGAVIMSAPPNDAALLAAEAALAAAQAALAYARAMTSPAA